MNSGLHFPVLIEFLVAKKSALRQGKAMADRESDRLSFEIAEEILRRIFGDDLQGCNVSLDEIAGLIQTATGQSASPHKDLVDMYEKAIEALNLLATPPAANDVTDLAQLNSLLGERLDAIHKLTRKVMDTTALLQKGEA